VSKVFVRSSSSDILDEAHKIIYGDREETYGDPGVNLRRIANFWNSYLINKGMADDSFEITSEDVAMMMVLLKIARQQHQYKADNLVDAAGYLALVERIHYTDDQGTDLAGI
jgi:hypothetical protein